MHMAIMKPGIENHTATIAWGFRDADVRSCQPGPNLLGTHGPTDTHRFLPKTLNPIPRYGISASFDRFHHQS